MLVYPDLPSSNNPAGEAWLANYYNSFNNQFGGGGYEGGGDGTGGEDWDRWMNYIHNGGNGTMNDFMTGTKTKTLIVPLLNGLINLVVQMTSINPTTYNQQVKMQIQIRVFGAGYSDYNFVQTYYNNWNGRDSKATSTWKIDGDNDHGFFYNQNGTKWSKKNTFNQPYYRQGSQGYFEDGPNADSFFQAEWTLVGHNQTGERWDELGTFSWGFLYKNGATSPIFFIPSDNSIPEHLNNVSESLKYWNKKQ